MQIIYIIIQSDISRGMRPFIIQILEPQFMINHNH